VTIGGHPGLATPAERRARRARDWTLADEIEVGGLSAFIANWMDLPFFASQAALGPQWRQESVAQRFRGTARSYAQTLRWAGTGSQRPLWEALASRDFPHLAIAGQLDPKYTAVSQELGARTGAQVAIIEGAGHAAQYEMPAAVVEAIVAFHARIRRDKREAS
jgi:2-succinyl-6-hydroxy-2,4-cyclohexadiene-1-carboxylate synthase